jgi:basic membrane lipoprotein Med (substrate-binding protein (PBP1-ABC) superfamily)
MWKKEDRAVLVALLAAIGLAGCTGEAKDSGASSPPPPGASGEQAKAPAGALKVGLLVTGPVTDGGWNEIAYKGLQRIEKELGATINYQQVERAEEFESGFRGYARDGYALVFGHGAEMSDAAKRVAAEFPKTRFVTTGGEQTAPNLAVIRLAAEEGTYLLGMLGASMSKSGKLACIGGMELVPVRQAFDAFARGAKAVKPSCAVATTYVASWSDTGRAKEIALAQIRSGADILFPNADAAGLGVFQAVKENQAKGVLAFGANKDQSPDQPDVILASFAMDVPRAFFLVAQHVQKGDFAGKKYFLGMKDEVVSVVYNPKLESRIPTEVRKKLDATRDQILAGSLDVVAE